ncbi:MAG: FxsA family protein [Lutimaribacter sp.]|jgi:UPF0716 protein FxsA
MWLFLAFVMVPIIEIALFIQVGGLIGTWPTLAIVVLTAFAGTRLMKAQGALALRDVQRSFSDMRDPTEPLAHGAMILISGVLLLTPGFFTDALGLALLVPGVRKAVLAYVRARVQVRSFSSHTMHGHGPRSRYSDDSVIDGEFSPLDDADMPPKGAKAGGSRPSGWTKH